MPPTRCTFAAECGLARSISMEAALRVWQSFYCDGCFSRCERYRLHQAGQEVPARLLPNGRLLDGAANSETAVSRNDPVPRARAAGSG